MPGPVIPGRSGEAAEGKGIQGSLAKVWIRFRRLRAGAGTGGGRALLPAVEGGNVHQPRRGA